MELSQDQLKAFYEVARQGSFTKAALSLALTQSALSHRIKNLESHLETSLFVRASTGIRLTETGKKLLQYVQVQGQIENEFLKDLQTADLAGLHGLIRIAGASTLMWSVITPTLTPLLRANPNVRFDFMVRELKFLPDILKSSECDMIVTCGKQNLYQYEEVYLGNEVNALWQSKNFNQVPDVFLDHDENDDTTIEFLKLQGKKLDKITRSYMDTFEGIMKGVELGLGKAVLPLHLVKDRKNFEEIKKNKALKQPIYLCFLKQPFYTKLQTSVIETLKENAKTFLEIKP